MALLIREYGHLVYGKVLSGDGALSLSKQDFEHLERQVLVPSAGSDGYSQFFKLSSYKGQRSLQVQNYVGVLQMPSGIQIEILPKIYAGDGSVLDYPSVRTILVRMLGTLRNSPFQEGNIASLAPASLPLLEAFMGYFLGIVNKLVKRGIRSDYKAIQENLGVMKGKLLVAEHIRQNLVNQHRFYVEYDEYHVDRPENRLIRTALEKITALTRDNHNQRLARELLCSFDNVPRSQDIRADLGRCSKERGMAYYQHVLEWCRLLLLEQRPLGSEGTTNTVSLLFPMEQLFEDYVAARLHVLYPSWRVQTQVSGRYLATQVGRGRFLMRPDLLLSRDNIKVVADTKWKLLGQDTNKPLHASIKQSDLYQMFAYGMKYLRDQEMKEVYLIYPRSQNFTEPLEFFEYEDDFRLYVVPFDLSPRVDSLLLGEEGRLAEMRAEIM